MRMFTPEKAKMFGLWTYTFLLFFFTLPTLSATHNIAGEITYQQTGPLTVKVTITTYTKASSTSADRDSLEVSWGDGSNEIIVRSNGEGTVLGNDVKVNYYIKEHTYPGRNTYIVSFTDPNRVSGILNVNFPNSVDIPFFLATTFTLLDPQFQGSNNSVILLQPPLDAACVGKRFTHNPNAFDKDGDSIAYKLVSPFMGPNMPVPNYKNPDEIQAGPNNKISINPLTGELVWENPQIQGDYNIAIQIDEYRNGYLISSVIRDMQISVKNCNNDPPRIDVVEEICVIAGTPLTLPIKITDPNVNDLVAFSASGGPFLDDLPATISTSIGYFNTPLESTFNWTPSCNHVSPQPYQIVFKAVDNFFGDTTGLSTLKVLRIKVLAPKPKTVNAEVAQNKVNITWQNPYDCQETEDEYFRGFSVWRKINSQVWPPDTCTYGLENSGYSKIAYLTKDIDGNGQYFYVDNNVQPNTIYCYRVLAEFAKLSSSSNPYNTVQSISSDEVCIQTNRIMPLWTEASILQTDVSNGRLSITYTKPKALDLVTNNILPPYRMEVWMEEDNAPGQTHLSTLDRSFSDLTTFVDTSFTLNAYNTVAKKYGFQLHFYAANQLVGKSVKVFTPYLTVSPANKELQLSWSNDVPWSNYLYKIYRKTNNGVFELIDETEQTSYKDTDLMNGQTYCYFIETYGRYGITGILSPLLNRSQESCGIPQDNIAPCVPKLLLTNPCDQNGISQDFYNNLSWTVDGTCNISQEVAGYELYIQNAPDQPFELLTTTDANAFIHQISDERLDYCYYVVSVDSIGNKSLASNTACGIECPVYELPNTFTPNGDGHNDLFVPRKNLFVLAIDFTVYNEWGGKVFETTNPELQWNGQDSNGKELPSGAYFYTLSVAAKNDEKINVATKGYINLIRN